MPSKSKMGSLSTGWRIVLILAAFLHKTRGTENCTLSHGDDCKFSTVLHLQGSISANGDPIAEASRDFGGMYHYKPSAVVSPASVEDVVQVVTFANKSPNLTVAARGNGHSISGQAQALNGIVVNMTSLKGIKIHPGNATAIAYADVSAGELWIDVLNASLARGLAPQIYTDYLPLTVGGTLSNAGIGGQIHLYGPQIVNVLDLQVVTGNGEVLMCTREDNWELFYGALGGLGQFGIITRAKVALDFAPPKVRWIRVVYWKLEDFMHDQELLISLVEGETFDYIEGFVFVNSDDPINGWPSVPIPSNGPSDSAIVPPTAGPVLYCLELALYYNNGDNVDEEINRLLHILSYMKDRIYTKDLTFFEFLNRVHAGEMKDRASGVWDAPHPWLVLFVPKSQFVEFDGRVFREILKNGVGGPMLAYAMQKSTWDTMMSAVIPEDEDIFYAVSILRFNKPYPAGPSVDTLLAQNEEILQFCKSRGIRAKQYLGRYNTQQGWMEHFGNRWDEFKQKKAMFDPKGILAPGQTIFPRTN